LQAIQLGTSEVLNPLRKGWEIPLTGSRSRK
jgi:hypothetical protein